MFQTSPLVSFLAEQPRIQPEGILKASLRRSVRLGTFWTYTSGRLNRIGGAPTKFTSSGGGEENEKLAIRFRAEGDGFVDAVHVPLGRTGTVAGSCTVSIWTDDGGIPGTQLAGSSESLSINTKIPTTGALVQFTWTSSKPFINLGNFYWVVISTSDYIFVNNVSELWLLSSSDGDSELATYIAGETPPWFIFDDTGGANVVVCAGSFSSEDSINDSAFDFTKYALFAVSNYPIGERDLSLAISGITVNSGRSIRKTNVRKHFTSTGGGDDQEWWAIKFVATVSGSVSTVKVPLIRTGSPSGSALASIYSVSGGVPYSQIGNNSSSVAINTLSKVTPGATFTWTSGKPTIVKDTTYFVVIKTTGYTYPGKDNALFLGTDTTGSDEVYKYNSEGNPQWTSAGATVGANVSVGGMSINGTVTIPKYTGLDTAKLVIVDGRENNGWGILSSVQVLDGSPRGFEPIELWAVPEEDIHNYERILFFRSCDVGGGSIWQPVANGMDPFYTSILLRRENTLTISRDYVTYADLDKYSGRMCTFLVELHPAGGGGVSEYLIFANCYLNVTTNAPDNAMVTVNAEGGTSKLLFYTP